MTLSGQLTLKTCIDQERLEFHQYEDMVVTDNNSKKVTDTSQLLTGTESTSSLDVSQSKFTQLKQKLIGKVWTSKKLTKETEGDVDSSVDQTIELDNSMITRQQSMSPWNFFSSNTLVSQHEHFHGVLDLSMS